MLKLTRYAAPLALAALMSVGALAPVAASADAMGPAMVGDSAKGKVLTDAKGMTLYTFDKDTMGNGKSVCNDKCAANWPPFMADAGAKAMGDWSVVTRDDGKTQWAYKGWPLYGWVKDKAAGDVTGDGVQNVWHIAKP
ncbi:COG4315 family predicted lipoprotein [Radicibacter daui]|uniref:COG4315 family predicted lipoprotein n=1 Tax=Radicibacter daui TaxID=3064829 RepID=UPI004046D01A